VPSLPPRLATVATAVAAGALLCLSLPPFGFWPLAFVGLVLVDRLIADQPCQARFARGWLVAMGCFVPGLSWMTALTVPGTVIACVAYSAMLGAGIAAAPPGRGRWLALAGTWTVAELLRSSWPFGGVPLASLPIGQVAGPLAAVLRLGGPVLLLVCTILVGQSLAALVRGAWLPAVGLLAIPLVVLGAAQGAPQGHAVATAEIALVQGGGAQGTRQSDDSIKKVFAAHVEATALVEPPVDLMVWPEDVIDTPTPLVEDPWGIIVGDLARAKDAPLLVGAIEDAGENRFRNAVELFDADGQLVGRYEKVHRVPFGEWVPFRSLLNQVAAGALPRRDAVIGETPNYLDVPGPVGRVVTPISWEIFFPDRTREGVEAGARLVINPTNGSSFTGTIVQTQQVASSRMRAIESGRWVAQVAPTGFSAIIDDTGRIIERSSISEAKVIQRGVQLREGLTIYTRYGNLIGLILAAACILSGWTIEVIGTRRRQTGAALA
jgi:apolipoprotein N-acyltransferase